MLPLAFPEPEPARATVPARLRHLWVKRLLRSLCTTLTIRRPETDLSRGCMPARLYRGTAMAYRAQAAITRRIKHNTAAAQYCRSGVG